MKNIFISLGLLVALCFSCKDEEPQIEARLPGNWEGELLDVRVTYSLVTLHEERDETFDALLVFEEDGTVSFTRDGNTTTGTYSLNGSTLTTNVDFQVEGVDLSEVTFQVEELTQSRLRLTLDQDQEVEVPDFGEITANIEGELIFNRL